MVKAKSARLARGLAGSKGGSKLRRSGETPMERLSIYVPEALVTKLRVHCAGARQSISDAVSEALDQWLDRAGTARGGGKKVQQDRIWREAARQSAQLKQQQRVPPRKQQRRVPNLRQRGRAAISAAFGV